MGATLIHNARLLQGVGDPETLGWLMVDEGIIRALGAGEPSSRFHGDVIDAEGRILAPGLLDVHVHGAMGHDTMDATPDALREMTRFYAAHGVTGFLATTMSAARGEIDAALANVAAVMVEGTGDGAALLGAHVEGPCINVERRGCQDAAVVRPPDSDEYRSWFATNVVRLITVAPEIPGADALIREAVARGIRVAAGHTLATYDQMQSAAALGVTQATHLFNAMAPLHHREPGPIGATLTHPELYAQLIADGVHVHPAALDLAIRCKGVERTVLITDAMAGAGMSDGNYDLGGIDVAVRNGVARTPEGALAGSTLTLDRAVANIMSATGLPLGEAWRMASQTPAKAIGWPNKGHLAEGCDADLVLLDDLAVSMTMVGGEVVYSR